MMTAGNTRIVVTLALLGLVSGLPGVLRSSEDEKPEAAARLEEALPDLSYRSLSEEIDSEQERPPAKLDDEGRNTLQNLRDFWERENLPHEDQFFFRPFKVPPRKDQLSYYPCLDCHEDNDINNPLERPLTEEHEDIKLQHGGQRFWCPTCHNLTYMDTLRSLKERRIDFNRSYLLCGQCHFERQKDWFIGGHGKRIGNWNGERTILLCVECHNPHSPSIKPKRPEPPPERHRNPYNILTEIARLFQ
jgi:hypothetical protein